MQEILGNKYDADNLINSISAGRFTTEACDRLVDEMSQAKNKAARAKILGNFILRTRLLYAKNLSEFLSELEKAPQTASSHKKADRTSAKTPRAARFQSQKNPTTDAASKKHAFRTHQDIAKIINYFARNGLEIKEEGGDGDCFYFSLLANNVNPDPAYTSNHLKDHQLSLRKRYHEKARELHNKYYDAEGKPSNYYTSTVELNLADSLPPDFRGIEDTRRLIWNEFFVFGNIIKLITKNKIAYNHVWAKYQYAILVAMAENRPVHIYQPGSWNEDTQSPEPIIFNIAMDGRKIDGEPIRLYFTGNDHFQSVVPMRPARN
jgi:hypothetical protein